MKAEIKNLRKAANRIRKASKSGEKIVLYGDADLDGISSVIILKESIKTLGGNVAAVYFPDREKEGYGISEKALNNLKKHAPALFVALDCGIGNFKEIKIANKLGFEVIVVDHHEILEGLPEASIIIDPKQKGDKYHFKYFATVGLAFKLSEAVFGKEMPESLRKNFLELTALATIADMMPRVSENDIMIAEGLNYVRSSWRPGIKALFGLKQFKSLSFSDQISKVNSLLNVRDVKDGMPAGFRLLTSTSEKEAKKLAERLFKKGIDRREKIGEILKEIEAIISAKSEEPVIFEGSPKWDLALIGVVASLLVKRYGKPAFLAKTLKGESQGGIRAPSGCNVVEAMRGYSKHLITYGGHPQAAGFRIKNENLEGFKKHLIKYFSK